MPIATAARLAKALAELEPENETLVVDLPNHGFIEAVKSELERLGHLVELDRFKHRLTIRRASS